ncbi:MAG: NAD-glutamate dehydrogenase, partial [Candidatus Competibacterales bacterium]|nr:NAD-glutamate dehydrogenase [Candidatus Competibacterales bacterium]
MGYSPVAQKNDLIEKVAGLLQERLPAKQVDQVKAFSRAYYAHVSPEDLLEIEPDDLYGAVLAHWNFAQQRKPGTALVRAYNPSFDEHGWQSTHSVLEVVTDDMPFLVDSVIMALNQHDLRVHLIVHPVMRIERDGKGRLQGLANDEAGGDKTQAESIIHCEFDRQSDPARLTALERDIIKVLSDVRTAVEDWPSMRQRMEDVLADLEAGKVPADSGNLDEIKAFLRWVADNNFIFLGCRDYDLVEEKGEHLLYTVPDSGLGVLRDDGERRLSPSFAELPPALRRLAADRTPLIVSKAAARSTVHRPAHMDYIGVKRYDDQGRVIGEQRFLGLYTAAAYILSTGDIPLLREKTRRIIERSGMKSGSHASRALQTILETFPRDELFQASEDELYETAIGILHLQERQKLRLFVREDLFQRFISCLVYVPRDRYNTDLRERMQALLQKAFDGESSTFSTQFSESVHARVHFHVRVRPGGVPDYSTADLEQQLREAMLSWRDEFYRALLDDAGEARGNALFERYGEAFPAAYRDDFQPRTAVSDVHRLEALGEDRPLVMWLYRALENPDELLHFKVFGQDQPLPLSDVLPILERMGLRVLTAHPYELELPDGGRRWVLDFDMCEDIGIRVDVAEVKDIFQEAFASIWHGTLENDGFNRLVLGAGIPARDVMMLRAYSKYLLQTRVPFSQDYMQQTLCMHPGIVRTLVELFHARFDPGADNGRAARCEELAGRIEQDLEQVVSLDEDRILRRFLAVVQATLRTNFYQPDRQGQSKDYLSFKFDPTRIPELPKPLPMFEIFVYSSRVEAVHLRGGPVARGGLRWSDRREDFRTEILGLVKAQMVKNSVIVPVGSKGGFVVKRPPKEGGREALQQEVQDCYRTFISGMLDITDNRVEDRIEPPQQVVRHDRDDPYLVVAADKGTATFSDLANSIAIEYGFWLGDAFASGGANGYD